MEAIIGRKWAWILRNISAVLPSIQRIAMKSMLRCRDRYGVTLRIVVYTKKLIVERLGIRYFTLMKRQVGQRFWLLPNNRILFIHLLGNSGELLIHFLLVEKEVRFIKVLMLERLGRSYRMACLLP